MKFIRLHSHFVAVNEIVNKLTFITGLINMAWVVVVNWFI